MWKLPLAPNSPVKPTTSEERKNQKPYRLGYIFDLPKISEIPQSDFELDQNPVEDQREDADTADDMCTAYALTSCLEPQEGVPLEPGFSFAAGKRYANEDPDEWGQTLNSAGMGAVKYGALPVSSELADKKRAFWADYKNISPEQWKAAEEHKQKSVLWVDGPYDLFDNIRATLWLLKTKGAQLKRTGIQIGMYWYPQFGNPAGGVVPKTYSGQPTGHSVRIRGQKMVNGEPYLVVQNSYGTQLGQAGLVYFPREVINAVAKDYGAMVFVDIDPEEIKQFQISLIDILKRYIAILKYLLQRDITGPVAPVTPAPLPTPTPPPAEGIKQMIWRVCYDERLTALQAKEVYATIGAESEWDPDAMNDNANGSKDVGLCQLNTDWYIGPDKEVKSIGEALANPEKCVRVMCRAWKAGRKSDWIAWRKRRHLLYWPKVAEHPYTT